MGAVVLDPASSKVWGGDVGMSPISHMVSWVCFGFWVEVLLEGTGRDWRGQGEKGSKEKGGGREREREKREAI